MAEIPPPPTPPTVPDTPDPLRYWCHHCEKRVSVETLFDDRPDLVCFDCKNGFVESITAPSLSSSSSPSPPPLQSPSFNHQFLQILRLVARAARDESPSAAAAPPPAPIPDPSSDTEDFLRIEFDGWGNDDDHDHTAAADDADDEEFIDDLTRSVTEIEDDDDDDDADAEIEEEEEENRQRQRRDLLRLRIRSFADRGSGGGRNLDLDWAEIIRGLEDHTIELRVEVPDGGSDGYVGNPEDYVDAAGYEVLLQNLAETESGSRRGAPPAASSAIVGLPTVKIEGEGLICAVCKEGVSVGKKLPCEHVYHVACILPWLESRNSCPVCRFELPTDDLEYEAERKKRLVFDDGNNNVF